MPDLRIAAPATTVVANEDQRSAPLPIGRIRRVRTERRLDGGTPMLFLFCLLSCTPLLSALGRLFEEMNYGGPRNNCAKYVEENHGGNCSDTRIGLAFR